MRAAGGMESSTGDASSMGDALVINGFDKRDNLGENHGFWTNLFFNVVS